MRLQKEFESYYKEKGADLSNNDDGYEADRVLNAYLDFLAGYDAAGDKVNDLILDVLNEDL